MTQHPALRVDEVVHQRVRLAMLSLLDQNGRSFTTATRELPESARPTTILVSHRFATATTADEILVLDNGTIIERGNHKSLVKAGGHYAELYELQTRAYR